MADLNSPEIPVGSEIPVEIAARLSVIERAAESLARQVRELRLVLADLDSDLTYVVGSSHDDNK